MRCEIYDLPADQCAHCGASPGSRIPLTEPERPWGRVIPLDDPVDITPVGTGGGLTELEDLYHRLHEELPATSKGRSADNAAAYAPKPDPRRAPLRVEVVDLIGRIETEVPDLARSVCAAMGVMRCVVFPNDSANGESGPSPRVAAALDTLRRHRLGFEEAMPEMFAEVEQRLGALVTRGRRLVGQTAPPAPLARPCPSCGQQAVIRVETENGWVAVCTNPEDRDEWDERRQWSETAWEDATASFARGRR